MYKLVAIDLDGTLVTDDKELTPRTIKVIKEASRKNVKIMISSGRSFYRRKKQTALKPGKSAAPCRYR